MSGLSIPDNFPIVTLQGQELSQLSIGRHHVRLNFIRIRTFVAETPKYEDGAAIDIEAGFEFENQAGEILTAENSDLAQGASSLVELLGCTVTYVHKLSNNELQIDFSNKAKLVLNIDFQGFESYHLHIDGESVDITKEW